MLAPAKAEPALLAAGLIVCALALVALAESAGAPAPTPQRSARPVLPTSARSVQALRDGEALDLNRVEAADLVLLPGVGPKLAARIVAERTRRGGFASIDALLDVKGIGPRTLERLRPWLRLEAASDRSARPRSPAP